MGCDWSKTAGSVDDLRDAPYSLLSVSVEEGKLLQNKMSPAGKKRDKRRRGEKKGEELASSVRQGRAPMDGAPNDKENTALPKPDISIAPLKPKFQLDISKTLDLKREPTERQQRQEKLARYERDCTRIEDYMFVGGLRVAENKELLLGCGITHVLNCAAITTDNFFPESFTYKALYINDAPSEDLACHIYEVVKFIDEVRAAGRRVLVHCTQGVSRSCSYCIAYLMLRERLQYEEAFNRVKARRGICNPNAGFCSQLVRYGRRVLGGGDGKRNGETEAAEEAGRVLKVDYYYPPRKEAGVAAMQQQQVAEILFESGAAYVCQTSQQFFIWVGEEASELHKECALREVKSFQDHERAPAEVSVEKEGQEREAFLAALGELGCRRALQRDGREGRRGAHVASEEGRGQAEGGGAHARGGEEGTGGERGRSFFPVGGAECVVQTPRVHVADAGGVALKLDGLGKGGDGRGTIEEEGAAKRGGGEEREEAEEAAVRMFEVLGMDEEEGFEEIETFDSDDLWASKAFVLVHQGEAGREVVVWIGGEFEGVEDVEDEGLCRQFAADAKDRFCSEMGMAVEEMEVVVEGEEPDSFWDLFELG